MSGNTFGTLFTVTSFGESHGPAIGCVVDGCPPGLEICEADIQAPVSLVLGVLEDFERYPWPTLAGIDFLALDPVQQRLRHAANLGRNRFHGCPQRRVVAPVLLHHAHSALAHLG